MVSSDFDPIFYPRSIAVIGASSDPDKFGGRAYMAVRERCGQEQIFPINPKVNEIEGLTSPLFQAPHFKEFAVSFSDTGKTVEEVNRALLSRQIFGGKDLTQEFPKLGETALYCVTEVHTKEDIDTLVDALKEVTQ